MIYSGKIVNLANNPLFAAENMTPFLKQVASHYFQPDKLERTLFVFPNRRSIVFFRKYLAQKVKEQGIALEVPPLYTISDFFCEVHGTQVTDRIRLLLTLYDCYKELYPKAEPLDEFIFWGDMILSDFSDIDKYLVDARSLFQNVSDLKAIQDSYAYLSETQRAAIDHFLSHFRERKSGVMKERFLGLWNILYPLYRNFNDALERDGMAYEGKVYRSLAERLKEGSARDILAPLFPETEKFVFVGLNALNLCEKLLLKKMRDARIAGFVWDFSSEEIQDPENKSSLFLSDNIREFPPEFVPDPEGLGKPEIRVISVPSSVGQVKLAPQILSEIQGDPVETAFVLPDESLLLPLLSSIPEQYDSINVTMGFPMTSSAVYTLVSAVGSLQMQLRHRSDNSWYFYHRSVSEVFSASLFREALSPEETAVVEKVKQQGKYYIPLEDVQGGPLLELVFRPIITRPKEASAAHNHEMEQYLQDILLYLGSRMGPEGETLLELDFAKRCHTALNILREKDLPVLPATHLSILDSLLKGISVPFRGEPLQGLQIMGPLETRALDFRNLVIFSANENTFPRKSFNSSFIPPELRKGFGLPTHEYQDAVWAYYFYRMIQRAEKVWLVYDSRTEGVKSGEESRYIKQLEYHFGMPLQKFTAAARMHPVPAAPSIPKTPEHIARIREMELSATLMQDYLFCPAKFYYKAVEGLAADDEVAESLDAGMLGNVFHKVMQQLYTPFVGGMLRIADLDRLQKDRKLLRQLIRNKVMEEMKSVEVSGRNLILERVLLDYVENTLAHDRKLLADTGSEGFRILGLESRRKAVFHGFRFKGFVDRIDSYLSGQVRILDYKTGAVKNEETNITDENAAAIAEKLFAPPGADRPKIALQLFLYDYYLHQDPDYEKANLVNAIYNTVQLYTKALEDHPESLEFSRIVKQKLEQTLDGLVNPDIPFLRTEKPQSCAFCDFKMICGR